MTGFEDAAALALFGRTVYLYGLFAGAGLLFAGVLLLARGAKRAGTAASVWPALALAPLLGLICARLVFAVSDTTFREAFTFRNLIDLPTGGFAMYGALTGACLGLWLSARLTRQSPAALYDAAAPALFLFIAFARAGEGFTAIGTGRPLLSDVLRGTLLTVRDAYGDYLRTYVLEAAIALVLCCVALRLAHSRRRPGDAALWSALLYGVTQTLMESLRSDRHLDFGFVGLQHVLSAVLFGSVLIYAAVRWLRMGRPKALPVAAIATLPVLIGLIIALEFAIDRTEWNKWLCYLAYVLLLCWPAAAAGRLLAGSEGAA